MENTELLPGHTIAEHVFLPHLDFYVLTCLEIWLTRSQYHCTLEQLFSHTLEMLAFLTDSLMGLRM